MKVEVTLQVNLGITMSAKATSLKTAVTVAESK